MPPEYADDDYAEDVAADEQVRETDLPEPADPATIPADEGDADAGAAHEAAQA